jgi:flavin-dependent dehydrogenase
MSVSSPPQYDLAVVGAGPGGSTAAALARRRGWKVLLLEKEAFPRFRIGESLLPMGNAILQASGVWAKVEAAGFFPKYGARFHSANGQATQAVDFRTSLVPGLDRTYQVERSRFDQLLAQHAADLGAEVRFGSRVDSVAPTATGVRLQLTGSDGPSAVDARWVIDAGGRLNAMATDVPRTTEPSEFPKRVAIFSHFEGVKRMEGRSAGDTVVVRLKDGWFWLIPLDAEKTSVGLVLTADELRNSGQTPEAQFAAAVASSAKLSELCGQAVAVRPYQVTSDYTYFHQQLASERVLRIGDAAGFFDPIFSSGVYLSLASAQRAVEAIALADAQQRSLSAREQRAYTRQIKRQAGTFERLIAAFYDNASFEVFMVPEIPFNLRPGLTAIVAGHSRLTWPLRWRFYGFLLACAIQRRLKLPLAPHLDLGGAAVLAP